MATMARKMPRTDDGTVLNFRARKGLEDQSPLHLEDGETVQQRKGLILGHALSQRQSRPQVHSGCTYEARLHLGWPLATHLPALMSVQAWVG